VPVVENHVQTLQLSTDIHCAWCCSNIESTNSQLESKNVMFCQNNFHLGISGKLVTKSVTYVRRKGSILQVQVERINSLSHFQILIQTFKLYFNRSG